MDNILKRLLVIFDPNKKIAQKGEVLVGLGNTQEKNDGIVLQHKTGKIRYDCLSQFVYETNFNILDPDTCCQQFYIEDLSVDTVLPIWLFLHKVHKEEIPENVNVWIDYSSRWEQGDTSTTGEAFESYGCLQNALVLSQRSSSPSEVLSSSLFFLDFLIGNDINPAAIPADLDDPNYALSFEALKREFQNYESIIDESETAVLQVPQKDSDTTQEVSAIFIQTEIVSSIQKVFLRNDKLLSPTKDGFALMAAYSPKAIGTGNDIVISVDPQKHIWLRELWLELEKEEDKLWSGARPDDSPRPLASYPDNNGPNEPWWDDMGNYTLIASPKKVGDEYGRRVSWETVKQIIKQLYAKGAN